MLLKRIQKVFSFIPFLSQSLRPGLTGNIFFLIISLAMITFIAQSGLIDNRQYSELEPVKEESTPAFTDDEIYFFQDTITQYLLNRQFNGSVLLARNGTVLVSRSFGFADFRSHAPLTQETPFQLASISKTFTAAAVLLLQDQGRLSIDDPVADHIQEFPYPQITVRMLLNHTSGLQNYMWLVERYWRQPHPPTNEDMLRLFNTYPRPLDFRSGTRFAYSNTGYAFLGLLIERVSGQRFPHFMQTQIFDPLDMPNTWVYDLHNDNPAKTDRVFGFRSWGRGHIVIPDVDHDGVFGDKGIYSNVLDLYTWDRAISGGKLLSETVWHQAFDYTRLGNNRPVNYGLGWRLQTFLDKRVVHHPGRWNGFRTSFKRFIEDDATLILLSNTNRDITPLINGLQNILFHKEIAALSQPPAEDPDVYDELGGQ